MVRVKKLILKDFRRFHSLTIDLGDSPNKVIAIVGPNGSGKSCVFDAFEVKSSQVKGVKENLEDSFYLKRFFSEDITSQHDRHHAVTLELQPPKPFDKKSLVLRSSYRFTGRLNVTKWQQKPDVIEDPNRPASSMHLDPRLTDNYERLFADYITEIDDSDKSGKQVKLEILDRINNVLNSVLDIKISSIGNILKPKEGQMFFEKGTSKRFPYDNLSSGEKEVIDIVLDLIIKTKTYNDTIYCIDEPELHLNTAIQRKLMVEIEKLIPDSCQLWIATHSVGFLRALQDELKNKAQVIDFSESDFDRETTLKPIMWTRDNWKRLFSTALEDLTGLIAPKRLIYCEGRADPKHGYQEAGVDAQVYNQIFSEEFNDTLFVSSGGCTEPDKYSDFAIMVLGKALNEVEILLLKDMDINANGTPTTEAQRTQWIAENKNRRMLKRPEIENYLFDFEVITHAYPHVSKKDYENLIPDIMGDIKDKAGELKSLCKVGNEMNKEKFKIHLAAALRETSVYGTIKSCIFP